MDDKIFWANHNGTPVPITRKVTKEKDVVVYTYYHENGDRYYRTTIDSIIGLNLYTAQKMAEIGAIETLLSKAETDNDNNTGYINDALSTAKETCDDINEAIRMVKVILDRLREAEKSE